ncbi:MAG TPA: hypothetical protein ENI37_00005 [Chloroflexi bacterium]|nr:hypothetical protein [Chloroflexota bacterium]
MYDALRISLLPPGFDLAGSYWVGGLIPVFGFQAPTPSISPRFVHPPPGPGETTSAFVLVDVLRNDQRIGRAGAYIFEDVADATAYLGEVAEHWGFKGELDEGAVVGEYSAQVRTPRGYATDPIFVCIAQSLDEVVVNVCLGRGALYQERYSGEHADVGTEFVTSAVQWIHSAIR